MAFKDHIRQALLKARKLSRQSQRLRALVLGGFDGVRIAALSDV